MAREGQERIRRDLEIYGLFGLSFWSRKGGEKVSQSLLCHLFDLSGFYPNICATNHCCHGCCCCVGKLNSQQTWSLRKKKTCPCLRMEYITMQGVRTLYSATRDGLTMEKISEGTICLGGIDVRSIIIAISLIIHILSLRSGLITVSNMKHGML